MDTIFAALLKQGGKYQSEQRESIALNASETEADVWLTPWLCTKPACGVLCIASKADSIQHFNKCTYPFPSIQVSEDNIYAMPLKRVGDFRFDEAVVDVFPDMIGRSVPGYGSILSMIGEVSEQFVVPQSNIYDLGCSLGAATLLIRQRVASDCMIHAVDSSPAMISRLRERLADDDASGCSVTVHQDDLTTIAIENASLVVLNFTLQFIAAAQRADVLSRICSGMLPGGALVLSEKISFDDKAEQQRLTELHHAFKRANGYSELEIAQKRTALENTLIPETLATHRERLYSAGFSTVVQWFQCFNFASILAVK